MLVLLMVFGATSFARAESKRGLSFLEFIKGITGKKVAVKAMDDDKEVADRAFLTSIKNTKTELHINENGVVEARGLKVTSLRGAALVANLTLGSGTIVFTLTTDNDTKFNEISNGRVTLADVAVGDMLNITGNLASPTADLVINSGILVQARTVHILKIVKMVKPQEIKTITGVVRTVSSSPQSFALSISDAKSFKVQVSSATKITKGSVAGTFADIVPDLKARVTGLVNAETNVIEASEIQVTVSAPATIRTILEGKLKATPNTIGLPAKLILAVNGVDYTVMVTAQTSILNRLWLTIPLASLRVGDEVRAFGLVNTEAKTSEATVVRDISL